MRRAGAIGVDSLVLVRNSWRWRTAVTLIPTHTLQETEIYLAIPFVVPQEGSLSADEPTGEAGPERLISEVDCKGEYFVSRGQSGVKKKRLPTVDASAAIQSGQC